jgi:ankyrin repeat protein
MFESLKISLTDAFERAWTGKTRIASLDWLSAARHGKLDEVKELLKKTNVDAQDKFGRTALCAAAANGKVEVVRFLLSAGARTDIRDNSYGAIALHAAAQSPDPAVLDILIPRTADINDRDNYGETPYQYAHRTSPENAQKLKDAGANTYLKPPQVWVWGLHPHGR